jgi:hypothetical protein
MLDMTTKQFCMVRNALIFHNKEATMCEIVEAIKYTSLRWFIVNRYAACVLQMNGKHITLVA